MSRRPTRRRTAVDETADDERAYGTDGYWQRRYTARAQGSGLSASAAGVQEDVTYATQARTPDSQTGLLLTRIILVLHRDEWMFGWQQLKHAAKARCAIGSAAASGPPHLMQHVVRGRAWCACESTDQLCLAGGNAMRKIATIARRQQ